MAALSQQFPQKTVIQLGAALGKRFFREKEFQLDTGSAREVFRALKYTVEGFEKEIMRLDRLGMRFAIFRNGKNVGSGDFDIGGTRTLRIVPVINGSKRAGVLQTIIGVVLLVASIWFPALAPMGIGMLAGGVMQMLSPQPGGLLQSASPENLPSYAFGSAKNTTASGSPVPICIGERRWGGAIISASILAEDKA